MMLRCYVGADRLHDQLERLEGIAECARGPDSCCSGGGSILCQQSHAVEHKVACSVARRSVSWAQDNLLHNKGS